MSQIPQYWHCPGAMSKCPKEWKNFISGLRDPKLEKYAESVWPEAQKALTTKFEATLTYGKSDRLVSVEFSDEGYLLFLLHYK